MVLVSVSCGDTQAPGSGSRPGVGGSAGSSGGSSGTSTTSGGSAGSGASTTGGSPSGGTGAVTGGGAGDGGSGGVTGGVSGSGTVGGAGGASAGSAGNAGSGGSGGSTSGGAAGSGAGSGGTAGTTSACGGGNPSGRIMECLDRGVIAPRSGSGNFVSWRLFGTDAADVTFRLYRQNGTAAPVMVCARAANQGTSCLDANPGSNATYFVRPVAGGVEGAPSPAVAALAQDYLRIPLQPAASGAYVHLAWVGDLDGDGSFDVVVDRISSEAPLVEGYSSKTGARLFRLNTGPLGANQDNIEGGASTLSNGHWDGVTVFDFDADGDAEVAVKTANGFVFGDGAVLRHTNDQDQFVSIVNGRTGAEITRAPLPNDYLSDGPLQCHFGAGYLDGVRPSVIVKCKNRVGSGAFNLVAAAYDFSGTALTRRWKFTRSNNNGGADYHQIRILDVDGDGKDEVADGGYVIDDGGTMLYALGGGVVHGDRFHITDMDPARPGLEGWGIQQDNPNGLETYYYDARTGQILRSYSAPSGAGADMGRGTVADLFPDQPGFEYWSFNGMYAAGSGTLVVAEENENVPWPNFLMQWDGDTGGELLDNNRVGDWNLTARSRNTYSWRRTFDGLVQARGAIPFYGDIFGDWREEALLETSDHAELRIYTTTYETNVRLYTLAHNPAYRNSLTVHGYKQSHLVDYFLGHGMAAPPAPRIRLAARP
jgi:rhamnogalacturonan endolyase